MPGSGHDLAHDAVLAALIELEHQLLDPAVRVDPSRVRDLLHEDFEEVGRSGTHWHRDAIVDALRSDPGVGAETSQVDASFLDRDVVLITYAALALDDDHTISRHASVWVRTSHRWTMRYHQGTPVLKAPAHPPSL